MQAKIMTHKLKKNLTKTQMQRGSIQRHWHNHFMINNIFNYHNDN